MLGNHHHHHLNFPHPGGPGARIELYDHKLLGGRRQLPRHPGNSAQSNRCKISKYLSTLFLRTNITYDFLQKGFE